TSDGSGFPDYAWAQLRDTANHVVATLLTAQTEPDGVSIIPGSFPLPAIDATLTPPSVPIIGPAGPGPNNSGGPAWNELGSDSGRCWLPVAAIRAGSPRPT